MDVRRIPVYANILLWILHVAVAVTEVLPPTKVTFDCHNMRNTLSWEYDGPLDGVTFQVVVMLKEGKSATLDVEPPNMFQDLSEFSDPDNEYAVFVKAVKENVESEEVPVEGIEYSYFQDSLVPKICELDLPLVNVTALDEHHLHYSFTHPAVLYPSSQRQRRKKSHDSSDSLPVFDYHIDILNQGSDSLRHYCTERQCQDKIQVHGSQKSYCLNISGDMRKISVRSTKLYCSEPLEPPRTNPLAYIIPIAFAVVLCGVFIGYMVFKKRTTPSARGPSALSIPDRSRWQQNNAPAENSEYASVTVEPSSPEPLIPPDQDTSNNSSDFRDELRFPLRVPNPNHGENDNHDANANANEEAAGEQGGAEGPTENGYTQGNALEEEEEEEEEKEEVKEEEQPLSAYERREKIQTKD